jgi:hypothetical protein
MTFNVERSHIIFKHLIHAGPEINAEAVVELALSKGYTKGQRQLKTPAGPLKEYLFRPNTNPQSLIVFSSKGFVIDARPGEDLLILFRDAYDFYEKVLGTKALTATIVMEINANFEVFSSKAVSELLTKMYNNKAMKIPFGDKELTPKGITIGFGSGKFPDKSVQITIQPLLKDPEKRLSLVVLYRSIELDDALQFMEDIEDELIKTLEAMAKV